MSTEGKKGLAARSAAIARFLLACWKVNLASALEYRLSFFLLAGMMFVNNVIWLAFWGLFFHRFPVVSGWRFDDILMLWAISAGGFGWANMLFGNFHRIATIVSSGQLDVYLAQPKPVLLHVLASRMSVTAAGDFLFGLAVYAVAGDHSIGGLFAFLLGLLISGLLFIAILMIAGNLAFFIGNAEGIAQQAFNSFVALTTYPSSIFKGWAKILLFTAVPAGFISYLPIGLLRDFEPAFVLEAVGLTAGLTALGSAMFYYGLRKYTSGNAIAMRS